MRQYLSPIQGSPGEDAFMFGSSGHGPTARSRSRGQSVAEFALIVPVVLLIVLVGLDFGRLFYSWVTVTNAARVAANYASLHPTGDFSSGSTYESLVTDEAQNPTCPVPTAPAPVFVDRDGNGISTDVSDDATVRVACTFRILTPIISGIVGSNVNIAASSTFQIRMGVAE